MRSCLRHFKYKLFGLFFLLIAVHGFSQTYISVTYTNSSVQAFAVATTGKLYFSNANLMIVTSDAATPTSIPTSIIQKITFSAIGLPLHFVDFTLLNEKAQVSLYWITENEVNTSHFVIERSADGTSYESIGQVTAANTTVANNYNFIDASPKTGTSYYRLKQVDKDGNYTYSKILSVSRSTSGSLILLPNPATAYFVINSSSADKLTVKIYSVAGQLLITGTYSPGEQIPVSKLTPGMYVAIINDEPYKLIKQ